MIRSLTSIFVWLAIALDTFFVFIVTCILYPFDPNQRISYHVANFWGKTIVKLNPFWKISIAGSNHIKKGKAYVLVANHNSLGDIVCLYCLGKHFKWLAKDSLFKIPFFGWTMSLLKYIPLKRGEHGSIRDSFQKAQEWLEKGISVLIFPEGTRSKTGQMGEFKNGAFKLALRTGRPIVPIIIQGTRNVISKGRMTMEAKVRGMIKVLPEISISDYKEEDFDNLKTYVRNLMNIELQKLESTNSSRQNHQPQAV